MLKISDPLTFISDPGHGWLRVPLTDIAALGIEGDISECSFINGRFAYLEEDCDCAVFATACTAQDVPMPEIQDQPEKIRPQISQISQIKMIQKNLR